MSNYDVIVLGTGGIGSAALDQLARRGVRVLGIDRFDAGHDRGSSHGRTRVIRHAYYEHPDYVPLVRRAQTMWEELEADTGRTLYRRTGILQVGPPEGEVIDGVAKSAQQHAIPIERLDPSEVQLRFPGFVCDDDHVGLFEPMAGYLHVEECVVANLQSAVRHGAEHRSGVAIHGWQPDGNGVRVDTDAGQFTAGSLVITPGSWAADLLGDIGIKWRVLRKLLYWYATDDQRYDVERNCPVFMYESDDDIFYGFPCHDTLGLKVARHSGGEEIADPLTVDRDLDPAEELHTRDFLSRYLPGVSSNVTNHTVCLYTVTSDHHFVVDRHPRSRRVVFAAGLSGHGFKFAPALGQALAELALDGESSLPIDFLGLDRFRQ